MNPIVQSASDMLNTMGAIAIGAIVLVLLVALVVGLVTGGRGY